MPRWLPGRFQDGHQLTCQDGCQAACQDGCSGCGDKEQDGCHSGGGAEQGLGSRWLTLAVGMANKMAAALHGGVEAVRSGSRWLPARQDGRCWLGESGARWPPLQRTRQCASGSKWLPWVLEASWQLGGARWPPAHQDGRQCTKMAASGCGDEGQDGRQHGVRAKLPLAEQAKIAAVMQMRSKMATKILAQPLAEQAKMAAPTAQSGSCWRPSWLAIGNGIGPGGHLGLWHCHGNWAAILDRWWPSWIHGGHLGSLAAILDPWQTSWWPSLIFSGHLEAPGGHLGSQCL